MPIVFGEYVPNVLFGSIVGRRGLTKSLGNNNKGDCVENSTFKFVLSAVGLGIMLSGCASAPTQQQIAAADYGMPMSPDECKGLAERVIANRLKDPSSAQFRNEQPCQTGWVSSVPILGMQAAFGYVQRGEVNGKNSYGGYVGFRPFLVLMKDGNVIRSCITDDDGICMPVGQ